MEERECCVLWEDVFVLIFVWIIPFIIKSLCTLLDTASGIVNRPRVFGNICSWRADFVLMAD
jgi:hypothetical protein